jgi:poly-gamma-glutamate capsule biosynthesis protein CapA/YwtB (metallophosphatase superfamily)
MKCITRRRIRLIATVVLATAIAGGANAQTANWRPDPATFKPRDISKELENKMKGTFVITTVGDLLIQEPIGQTIDTKIQDLLRSADTTVGNMEAKIIDRRSYSGGFRGNWSPKETAVDIKNLGFDMLTGANNHTFDMGEQGLKSTIDLLDAQGIPLAGVGPNLSIARMPVFHYTPKGRVALVGAYAVAGGGGQGPATDREGVMGGAMGYNPLRVTAWNVVTPEQLASLKSIQDMIVSHRNDSDVVRSINMPKDPPGRVTVFDGRYMTGTKPGSYHYELNKGDEEGNILAIRNTKEYADFAVFTMHVHQNRYAYQAYSNDNYPPDYLQEFAHKLIDNGADIFLGHGNHTMQGIEIYKGRPIFYNLGNFAVHEILPESDNKPAGKTAVEADEFSTEWLQQPENLKALVATTKYQDGKLVEIRLQPVDLGVGKNRPWSQMSIAKVPAPALAAEILAEVQKYSEPFGTRISIENGVGVIRP